MIREKIISELARQGKTQREVCTACNLDHMNFNHFLKGRRPLPLYQVERVLMYLKIDLKKG